MKREVLLRTSLPAKKRFQTLVNDEHLDDRTPSHLLQRTRKVAEDAPADSALIKQLFFSRLLQNVQVILAPIVEISSANHLATLAARRVDISRQLAFFATLHVSSFSPTLTYDTN